MGRHPPEARQAGRGLVNDAIEIVSWMTSLHFVDRETGCMFGAFIAQQMCQFGLAVQQGPRNAIVLRRTGERALDRLQRFGKRPRSQVGADQGCGCLALPASTCALLFRSSVAEWQGATRCERLVEQKTVQHTIGDRRCALVPLGPHLRQKPSTALLAVAIPAYPCEPETTE